MSAVCKGIEERGEGVAVEETESRVEGGRETGGIEGFKGKRKREMQSSELDILTPTIECYHDCLGDALNLLVTLLTEAATRL